MSGFNRLVSIRSDIGVAPPVKGLNIDPKPGKKVVTKLGRPRRRSLASAIKDQVIQPSSKQSGLVVADDRLPAAVDSSPAEEIGLRQARREEGIARNQAIRGESAQQMGVQARKNELAKQEAGLEAAGIQTEAAGLALRDAEAKQQEAQRKQAYQQRFMDMADFANDLKTAAPNKQGYHHLTPSMMNKLSAVLPDFNPVVIRNGKMGNLSTYGLIEPNDPEDPNSPEVFSLYQDDGSGGPPRRVMNRGAPVRIPVETIAEFAKFGDKMQGPQESEKVKVARIEAQGKVSEVKAEKGFNADAWAAAEGLASNYEEEGEKLTRITIKLYRELESGEREMPVDLLLGRIKSPPKKAAPKKAIADIKVNQNLKGVTPPPAAETAPVVEEVDQGARGGLGILPEKPGVVLGTAGAATDMAAEGLMAAGRGVSDAYTGLTQPDPAANMPVVEAVLRALQSGQSVPPEQMKVAITSAMQMLDRFPPEVQQIIMEQAKLLEVAPPAAAAAGGVQTGSTRY